MVVERHTLVDDIVDHILEQILDGVLEADTALPPEADIAAEANASRLTAREAIKVLQARNIVQVRRGVGTFVNPPERWASLDAILRATARGVEAGEVSLRLLEARRIVETGAAELAATRRRPTHLTSMREYIDLMVARRDLPDVSGFTYADIAFHDTVLAASGNPFVAALLNSFTPLLHATRRETSEVPEIREHAIEHHRRVLSAIESGDARAARQAMADHLSQTSKDYEHYVAHVPDSP